MIPTTNYNLQVQTFLKDIPYNEQEEILHYHQFIINKFMSSKQNLVGRGLLIFHSMGFGKSLLAASILEEFRINDPQRRVIILLPKSLQSNFESAIKMYLTKNGKSDIESESILKEHYDFISSNSSTMFSQIGNSDKTKEEIEFEKNIGIFNKNLSGTLENTFLVIDEFHMLSNSITNGSKNALALYNEIMNTKNIKLLFLTGTPIINYPFEVVCTYNMLKGRTNDILFPESINDFITNFIDKKNLSIKNKERFQNRITGLTSYYGTEYFNGTRPNFPEEYPLIVEQIPMSELQYGRYVEFREIEKKEESRKIKGAPSNPNQQFNSKGEGVSSYRIRSRQVSNFLIPASALTDRGKKSPLKHIEKISPEVFKELEIYSPKFQKILQNLEKYKNQLSLVYSQFVSAEGIALFAKALKFNGYDEWSIDNDIIMLDNKKKESKGTYAIISGDINPSERTEIVKVFNDKKNAHGEIISILLISQTGATGLDLKGIRSIHIMEPFWNWSLILQIIGRGVRYMSHEGYPKEEQNVQPYLYLSVFPKGYKPPNNPDENNLFTTDMSIYKNAKENRVIIESFLKAMMEASIDCGIHHEKLSPELKKIINCHMCSPDNNQLYKSNFYEDMDSENTCKKFQQKSIKTEEIQIQQDDQILTFYYNIDDGKIQIFEFNEKIKAFVEMKQSHPFYADLIRKILKLSN